MLDKGGQASAGAREGVEAAVQAVLNCIKRILTTAQAELGGGIRSSMLL